MKRATPLSRFQAVTLTILAAALLPGSAHAGSGHSAASTSKVAASNVESDLYDGLHLIFSEPAMKSRAPASSFPEEFADVFAVEEPSDRTPASIDKRTKQKTASVSGRRSRLPATVRDGFEIRVKANGLVTTFWVVKRGDKYDLLYANSANSRSAVSLTPESFHHLHEEASRIPASQTNVKSCADNSMQIFVDSEGHPEQTATFCISAKTKAATQLKTLGDELVVRIR